MISDKKSSRRRKRRNGLELAAAGGGRSRRKTDGSGATRTTAAIEDVSESQPPVQERSASWPDRTYALLVTALVACATLPYLNILFNGFVYDDDNQVLKNPYIRSFHYLKEILTTNVWSFTGVGAVTNYYRPLMTLGYLFCYKIFHLRAYGFHLFSLLLHILVVCLLFAVTERLTGDRVWAFAAGALFALHPVHTESVAWIAAVPDLEVTFFYILTIGFFVAMVKPGGAVSKFKLAGMVVAFILAMCSKEQAMTLPVQAMVFEHFHRRDRSDTSALQKMYRYGPLWLVVVVSVVLRMHFLGALAPRYQWPELTPWQIALSAVALLAGYVGKLLAGAALRVLRFPSQHESVRPWRSRRYSGACRVCGSFPGLPAQPRSQGPLCLLRHRMVLCHIGSRA